MLYFLYNPMILSCMKNFKKIFSLQSFTGIHISTILFFALTFASAPVQAAECTMSAGSLVSPNNASAVYVMGPEGKLYSFPNADIYESWYGNDFSHVAQLSSSCIAQKPYGGHVTYRPGSRLVSRMSSPKVYAVLPGGDLRLIEDEQQARLYYGEKWPTLVRDVNDESWVSYKPSALKLNSLHNGQFITMSGGVLYAYENGEFFPLSAVPPHHIQNIALSLNKSITDPVRIADRVLTLTGPFQLSLPSIHVNDQVCTDEDDDGYNKEGQFCGPVDCNDSNTMAHPGGFEICSNGVDDNCDGQMDENECKKRRICLGDGCSATIIYE